MNSLMNSTSLIQMSQHRQAKKGQDSSKITPRKVKPLPDLSDDDLTAKIFEFCPESHLFMASVVSQRVNAQVKLKIAIINKIKQMWGSGYNSDGTKIANMLTQLNIIPNTKIPDEETSSRITISNAKEKEKEIRDIITRINNKSSVSDCYLSVSRENNEVIIKRCFNKKNLLTQEG